MGSHYGLRTVKSRSISLARKEEVLCDSLSNSLTLLDTIIPPVAYPKGSVLFTEGQAACGIFAVCSGQVKLSTSSVAGKAVIVLSLSMANSLMVRFLLG